MPTYPNFYLAGVPKSGTTSLYTYLLEHPNIFLPVPVGGSMKQKEPMYFATDLREDQDYTDKNAYLGLYADIDAEHLAIGDASVLYLYSNVALGKIRAKVPNAKIVVMLRNPIEAVVSYHAELYKTLAEDVASFEQAWRLQEPRRQGEAIPATCHSPARLQYYDVYDYPTQIERLWRIFPKEQTLILLFDDFKADTAACYRRIQSFLGLPRHDLAAFKRVNENKQLRSRFLARLLLKPPPVVRRVAEMLKSTLGINYTAIAVRLTEMNLAPPSEGEELSPEFRRELKETFEPGILKLSHLLKRDLSAWLEAPDDHN
jgi:hypothetical protein